MDLTDRQTEILRFIRARMARVGFAPSYREIGVHFGIKSTNAVSDHLRALARKGTIEFVRSRRGRRITPFRLVGCCAACGQPLPAVSS